MGLSSVLVYSAGFIVVMLLFVGGATMYLQNVEKAKETVQEVREMNREDIEIINATYDKNVTAVWASNEGETPLNPNIVDVYIDSMFIPRNSTNRNITVTEARNPGLWDPGEKALIEIGMHLPAGTHEVRVSPAKRSNLNAKQTFTSGITTKETLAVISGQWEPPSGAGLTSGELLALNNPAGTNITLNDTNKTAGLAIDNPSHQPAEVLQAFVLADYKAEGIGSSGFSIEAREGTYGGALICNKSFGPVSGLATASVNCSGISRSNVGNLYILLNNTALSGRNISVDYVRVNVTYIYEN